MSTFEIIDTRLIGQTRDYQVSWHDCLIKEVFYHRVFRCFFFHFWRQVSAHAHRCIRSLHPSACTITLLSVFLIVYFSDNKLVRSLTRIQPTKSKIGLFPVIIIITGCSICLGWRHWTWLWINMQSDLYSTSEDQCYFSEFKRAFSQLYFFVIFNWSMANRKVLILTKIHFSPGRRESCCREGWRLWWKR